MRTVLQRDQLGKTLKESKKSKTNEEATAIIQIGCNKNLNQGVHHSGMVEVSSRLWKGPKSAEGPNK